jgi:hypothetical protein
VDVHYRDLDDIEYRQAAAQAWQAEAVATLDYAQRAHAARGHLADTAGAIAIAACQAAHAVLAARGEWITNDKRLLDRAGLRGVDEILAGLTAEPQALAGAVARATDLVNAPGTPGPGR